MAKNKPEQTRSVRREPRIRTGGRSARVVKEVLAATLELLAAQGYAGLSFEGIAVRAGVAKTTIYRRWPTKPELVGAALLTLRDHDPETPDTGSLREDLFQVLQHWVQQLMTPHRRAISHALMLSNTDPELRLVVRRLREERPAIPPAVLTRAVKRGELPRGSDPQLITSALLGPLHARVFWKGEDVDDQFLRALVQLIVTGAVAGGARSS